jgi:hypothetical protein
LNLSMYSYYLAERLTSLLLQSGFDLASDLASTWESHSDPVILIIGLDQLFTDAQDPLRLIQSCLLLCLTLIFPIPMSLHSIQVVYKFLYVS